MSGGKSLGRMLKVAMTIIGTTIGAGFASGREVWEFFGTYGEKSYYSLIIATLLFYLSITTVLWISFTEKTCSYKSILEKLMGNKLSRVFDILIMIYLLSMSVVMFAGSGATFSQWNIPYIVGVFFMAAAVYIVLLFDIRGLLSLNSVIIPIMITILVYVCLNYIISFDVIKNNGTIPAAPMAWPSGITYVSLNIVPLIAVLSTLGGLLNSRREVVITGMISSAGLGMIAFFMNYSLLLAGKEVNFYEIPLFFLLHNYPTAATIIVSIILWFAIYTTALSGLYGLIIRIMDFVKYPGWMVTATVIFLMIPLSQMGFSTLVKFLYPLYGVINLFVLALLILYPLQRG